MRITPSAIKCLHTAIGHNECLVVASVNIALIDGVSIFANFIRHVVPECGRYCQRHKKSYKQSHNTHRKSEPESATRAGILCPDCTLGEDRTYLLVFFNNSLAIHQSKPMPFSVLHSAGGIYYRLMVKEMLQLSITHPGSSVANTDFGISVMAYCIDFHMPIFGSEFTCIVRHRIYHK